MRSKSKALFALVVCGSSVMAALGALLPAACGGSSDVKDSGPDVVADNAPPQDTGIDTGVAKDSGCDAPDLLTLMLPDGSVDGGANPAVCYNCIRMNCMSLLAMCNMDCTCRTTIGQLPSCIAMQGGSLQQAVLACTSGLDPQYLIGLAGCAGGCGPACGINPSDAGDGGG